MLAAFLLASATTYWAVLDGQITGHRMPTIVPLANFYLWPAALPNCLAWERRTTLRSIADSRSIAYVCLALTDHILLNQLPRVQ